MQPFSIRAAVARGNTVKFGTTKCWIQDSKGTLRGMGSLVDKLYQLDCQPIAQQQVSVATHADNGTDLWHQRLGHINEQLLQEMVSKELSEGVTVSKSAKFSFCEGCVEGKCTGSLLNQWERYSLKENCSVYTVTCVDQCPKSQLGGRNTLSHSLMTIPDVVRFTL